MKKVAMNRNRLIAILVGALAVSGKSVVAMHLFDNPHFYQASHFFAEPRFEKKGLASFDVMASRGATKTARNAQGNKVDLLSIYGPENICLLDQGLTGASCSQDLFAGKLHVVDLIFLGTQNIVHGFFVQLHVPFRKIAISRVSCAESCSCGSSACAAFRDSVQQLLANHGLCAGNTESKGVGEVSAYLGWAKNYQDTERVDFVDTTLKLGIVAPTGTVRNEDSLFSIPTGYNRFTGASISADISVGAYQWLTVGTHLRTIVFAAAQKSVRMNTGPCGTGFIKLASGAARIKPGTLYETGLYVKADHIFRGLSLLVAYSYVGKGHDRLTPCASGVVPSAARNDQALQPWTMQTVHYLIEYDFTKQKRFICPRLSLYCDQQMGGKRVFDADMTGVGFGMEIAW